MWAPFKPGISQPASLNTRVIGIIGALDCRQRYRLRVKTIESLSFIAVLLYMLLLLRRDLSLADWPDWQAPSPQMVLSGFVTSFQAPRHGASLAARTAPLKPKEGLNGRPVTGPEGEGSPACPLVTCAPLTLRAGLRQSGGVLWRIFGTTSQPSVAAPPSG